MSLLATSVKDTTPAGLTEGAAAHPGNFRESYLPSTPEQQGGDLHVDGGEKAAAPRSPEQQRTWRILSIRESYRGQHWRNLRGSEMVPLPASGWRGQLPGRAAGQQGLRPAVFWDWTCVRDRQ